MKVLASVLLGLSQGEIVNCTEEYLKPPLNIDCSGEAADGNSCDTTTHLCFTTPDCYTEYGCRLKDSCPCGASKENDSVCIPCSDYPIDPIPPPPLPNPIPPFDGIFKSFDCTVNGDFTLGLNDSTGFPKGRPTIMPDNRELCFIDRDTSQKVKELAKEDIITGVYGDGGECKCPFNRFNEGPISFDDCSVFEDSKRIIQQGGDFYTVWTFGIGFDDFYDQTSYNASYLKYRGYSWELECKIKVSGDVQEAFSSKAWERSNGSGSATDDLEFDLNVFFEGTPVTTNDIIELKENDNRRFQFNLDVVNAPEIYMPFYQKCDLFFHDANDVTSNLFMPEIIIDGCINPAYAEEFRVESIDTPGDALTWFRPKIFEKSNFIQTGVLDCKVIGCQNFGTLGCTPGEACVSDYPVIRNNGSSENVASVAREVSAVVEMKASGTLTYELSTLLLFPLFFFK